MAKTNLTADGSTIDYTVIKKLSNFSAVGTFGGGTVTIYEVQDDAAVTPILAFTEDFQTTLSLAKNTVVRMTLSGATTPVIDLYFKD